MTEPRDTRRGDLERLKKLIDTKWEANLATLVKSLNQGMISWRRSRNGEFEVKIKPELD